MKKHGISGALTPRLIQIAKAAKGAHNLADIGTDHAYVPIFMVLELGANGAIAADINKGPLKRADANIKKYDLSERVTTRLSDGLKEFSPNEVDTVIIAGMGGTLIAKILEDSPQMKKEGLRFVLQPMTAEPELRKYLEENGYRITDECMAREDEKLYTVINAELGKSEPMREVFYHVGQKLFEKKEELFPLLLDRKIAEFEKVISGLSKALNSPEINEKREYYYLVLNQLKELKKGCEAWLN